MDGVDKAIFAGGCFWGMQDLIRKRPGVLSTRVGYTGGDVANATYRSHGTHAEAIEIVFDPEQISYRDLLELFFQIHDPTTLNRQGNDVGTSYRSAIFSTRNSAGWPTTRLPTLKRRALPGKVVTEVTPAGPFWEAEPEHQDYLERYPNGYTCHFPRRIGFSRDEPNRSGLSTAPYVSARSVPEQSRGDAMTRPARIAVVYYSATGTARACARRGSRRRGAEVRMRHVEELARS